MAIAPRLANALLHQHRRLLPLLQTEMMNGALISFDHLAGLIAKGGEYVRNPKSLLWSKALRELRDQGISSNDSNVD